MIVSLANTDILGKLFEWDAHQLKSLLARWTEGLGEQNEWSPDEWNKTRKRLYGTI